MPTPRTDEQGRGLFLQRIDLAVGWVGVGDRPVNGVSEVKLTFDEIAVGRRALEGREEEKKNESEGKEYYKYR